jgi:hypothetical protein
MYRCEARTLLADEVERAARLIPSPVDRVEWARTDEVFRCKLEDEAHAYHAAFLRSGTSLDPCMDVFLCWRDPEGQQWLEDAEVCLKKKGDHPMGVGCTIFKDHPGRCDWGYIDPVQVATLAQADQLRQEWGYAQWSPRA